MSFHIRQTYVRLTNSRKVIIASGFSVESFFANRAFICVGHVYFENLVTGLVVVKVLDL
jgi:hypothetical protein